MPESMHINIRVFMYIYMASSLYSSCCYQQLIGQLITMCMFGRSGFLHLKVPTLPKGPSTSTVCTWAPQSYEPLRGSALYRDFIGFLIEGYCMTSFDHG